MRVPSGTVLLSSLISLSWPLLICSSQIEGVVCDKGLTLGDLMGTLSEFYKAIGITQVRDCAPLSTPSLISCLLQLRFKPAFNPYTEPSMEIFGMHPTLGEKEVRERDI